MTQTRGGTLLGVLFLLLGLGVIGGCFISPPPPTIPLLAGVFLSVLGALMINPTSVKDASKDLGDIVGPYIPVGRSGRRDTDGVVVSKEPPAKSVDQG